MQELACPAVELCLSVGEVMTPTPPSRSSPADTLTDALDIQTIAKKLFFAYDLSECFIGRIHNHSWKKANIAT